MKIIEALKELPVIEKRVHKVMDQLRDYSGLHSSEEPHFGTREDQRAKVKGLVQSNIDLMDRYAKLKRALALTNANTEVEIGGQKRSIAEWIVYREKGCEGVLKTLESLCLDRALNRAKDIRVDITEGVKIERMYSEEDRNRMLEDYSNIRDKIDSTLETVNATTDLVVEV